jgi:two-component system CheB/CheR fusion protein
MKKGETKKNITKELAIELDKVSGNRHSSPSHIVGIGASAGGLEALEGFFMAVPENSGIAFVVVAHLAPQHASILPELIQKKTSMNVCQVTDNMRVEPNRVYVIPPNKEMSILHGSLQLLELSKSKGVKLPIDLFLRSLAQDMGHRAVGIILSGTGTDGTLGIRAIKGETGMVMAQDVESARYDGMPRSAISTNLVDFILPPDKMPAQLMQYINSQDKKILHKTDIEEYAEQTALQKIFVLMRAATDHDFSQYKKNTIYRRIERRMHVHQIDNIEDYVRYLQESERECTVLFKELLIGVTNFFRDPEAFELLGLKYLPGLLDDKPDDYQVRIWVPGCSTGEEAYSIAMIVQEFMEAKKRHFSVQIFGTDLDEEAIGVARAGIYPESISADVSQERLKKYFTKVESHFLIKKNIREMVVFAPQNVIKDPPFTKLDMICCRNLLIYFGIDLQKKLLPLFHYSLRPEGLLFLGSSETIGQFTDLFAMCDKKWKIFSRKNGAKITSALDFPAPGPAITMPEKEAPAVLKAVKDINSNHLMKAILSQSDIPSCAVVDDKANIIYIHGHTGRFLEPAQGESSINILDMARPGLKAALSNAMRQMASDRQEIVINNLQVKENGGHVAINLILKPLRDFQTGHRGLMLVVFEEITEARKRKEVKKIAQSRQKKSDEVKRLEDELQYTRENLQTTIEELETSNEELKSTNEELQSTNEELQSTNEELETSKEELQSLNEESATVNSELQSRIDDLMAANDDIKNLLDATDIAILFLDINLNIRRFSAKTTQIFPLAQTDMGRPISHFTSNLKDVDLLSYFSRTLDDLEKQEVEVSDNQGRVYRVRIRPYRTTNNVIDGLIITFEDITTLRQIDATRRLAAVVKGSNDAITIQDLFGKIIAWNKGAEKIYGWSEEDVLGMNISTIVPAEKNEEILAAVKEKEMGSFETTRVTKDGRVLDMFVTVTRFDNDSGTPVAIATTEKDITWRKRIEKEAAEDVRAMKQLHRVNESFMESGNLKHSLQLLVDIAISLAGADMGNIQLLNATSGTLEVKAHLGFKESILKLWKQAVDKQSVSGTAMRRGELIIVEDITRSPIIAKTPGLAVMQKAGLQAVTSLPLLGSGAKVVGMINVYFKNAQRPDEKVLNRLELLARMTEFIVSKAHTVQELKQSKERYETLFNSIDEGYSIIEVLFDGQRKPIDYRFLEVNPAFEKQTGIVNAVGRRMREIAPAYEEHWLQTYGEIVLNGKPRRFESRAEKPHRWNDVFAFRFGKPEDCQVAILLNDITERKELELKKGSE